jgi:hypothetical protein
MTDHSGHNPVCDHRYPTRTCGRSNPAVRSSWDNVTSPRWGGRISREGIRRLTASRRSGARVDGMANSGELLINVVRSNKPKTLTGLNQTVRGQVQGDLPSPVVAVGATGEEAEPTPSLIHRWNVVSPSSSLRGRPCARGLPMGRRVEDEGRSERRPVVGRIGVEPPGEITPLESGLTSLGCLRTRPSEQLTWEAEQMTAAYCWCGLRRVPLVSPRPVSCRWSACVRPTGFREGPWERLERHKPKGLRVVLRGLGSSNAPRLPGRGSSDASSLPARQGQESRCRCHHAN